MSTETMTVIGGVDTHKHTHYAAVIDEHGRLLGHQQFPATDSGYRMLLSWMRSQGTVRAIGVESTGSFGATLTRSLTAAGEHVIEVNRPNRVARRMDGKSDRLDAEQIARAVLGQTSTAIPEIEVRNGRGHSHVACYSRQCGQGSNADSSDKSLPGPTSSHHTTDKHRPLDTERRRLTRSSSRRKVNRRPPGSSFSPPSPSPNSSGCSRSRSSSQSCHGRRSARWQRRWRCHAGSWTTPPTSCGRV